MRRLLEGRVVGDVVRVGSHSSEELLDVMALESIPDVTAVAPALDQSVEAQHA